MNPYQTPEVLDAKEPKDEIALKELVKSWERLRWRYNLILLPLGLIAGAVWVSYSFPVVAAIPGALAFGVLANLCFLLGPLVELYWRGLFLNGEECLGFRSLLFWAGTTLSSLTIIGFASIGFLAGGV